MGSLGLVEHTSWHCVVLDDLFDLFGKYFLVLVSIEILLGVWVGESCEYFWNSYRVFISSDGVVELLVSLVFLVMNVLVESDKENFLKINFI